ncbi:F0F1 ATP synthase subunit delta [Gammaproteobacteria bacterium]|nr:F0F1 ATP synthase subunit delta [Gammaproteobacteria bacterium]
MSENASIARPYAQAVFEIARESNAFPEWSQALGRLADLASQEQVSSLFSHPRVDKEDVASILIESCGDLLDSAGQNFVNLLVRNGRLGTLPDIAEQFELLRAEEERTITAKVESALPVSESHQKRISEALARKLGRRVELEVTMDATLIGGAVIRAGDLVIDGSVRARLEKLAAAISS